MSRRSLESLAPFTCLAAVTTLAVACGGHAESGSPGTVAPPSTQPAPAAPTCDAAAATDIAVSSNDVNGFPPYAVSGCTLVYVNGAGALVMRDLSTRAESTIAPATEHPRRPTVSSDVIAWEADQNTRSVVRVRAPAAGSTARTIEGAFASAGEPRASGSSVAFTGWNGPSPGDDTDVWLYDATTNEAHVVLGGPAQQRFPDLSSAFVAASDFSEDPDGRYDHDGKDLADIIVLDRATGVVTKRALPGKQAFPMLADGGVLAYLSWNGIHPEPKFESYELRSGPVLGDPAADKSISQVVFVAGSDPARPTVVGATIEWIANPNGTTTLYRAPVDASGAPTAVKGLESFHLRAPAPTTAGFTVLATSRIGASEIVPRLRAVPR
jgi:hypothetical protein